LKCKVNSKESLEVFKQFVDEEYEEAKLKPFTKDYYIMVETEKMLVECTEYLTQLEVVGIDIENHNKFSYEGFTCLL